MKRFNTFWTPTLILTACLAALISFTTQAQPMTDRQATINTSGSGSVSAVPDQAQLSFTIERRGDKLRSLKTQVDQVSRTLISDLLDRDIPQGNIRSMQLNVYPRYENNDGQQQQVGFVVMRSIDVTLPSLDIYDQVVDVALAQGVTRVGQVRFEVSNQSSLYQQALKLAYMDALKKAQFLAATADLTLGSAVQIVEQSMSRPMVFQMAEMSKSQGSPSLPGEQQIEARVDVTFQLKKQK